MRIWIAWKNDAPFLVSGNGASFNRRRYVVKQAGEAKAPSLDLDVIDSMVGMDVCLNRFGLRPDSHATAVALDFDI